MGTGTGIPGIMTGAMPAAAQPQAPEVGGMAIPPQEPPPQPEAPPVPGPSVSDSELLDLPDFKEPEPFDPKAQTEHASGASFQDILDLPDVPFWKAQAYQPPAPAAQPQQEQAPQIDTAAILEAIQNLPQDNPLWQLVPLFLQGGYQMAGGGVVPLGDYKMPDGSTQTGIGLPQGLLDAYRSLRQGLGFEQDPNAPKGYVSFDSMMRGGAGAAGSAITGSLGAAALRAMKSAKAPNHVSSSGAPPEPKPKPKPTGITAYHGSPHDFEKFDISKIGTGEGAQAYGHGLYFAESPTVARTYRDDNAARSYRLFGREVPGDQYRSGMESAVVQATKGMNDRWQNEGIRSSLVGTYTDAIQLAKNEGIAPTKALQNVLERNIERMRANGATEREISFQRKMDAERQQIFEKIDPSIIQQGRLYKVTINAKPEDFLSLDGPFADMPAAMQDKWRQTGLVERVRIGRDAKEFETIRLGPLRDKQATDRLKNMGIPGIRYLDQGSRGSGQGTYNYVLFDDSLVKIAEKYSMVIPGPNGMPAVSEQDFEKLKQIAKEGDKSK